MNTPTRTVLTLKRSQNAGPAIEERLHKVLANAGLGSRRMLEERIEAGEVKVNGTVAILGSSVRVGDRIEMDAKLFVAINDSAEHAQVLMFHKPEGVVTTRDDPEGRPTVFEQLPRLKGARWIAVGRLDINTTGLLLLTTDGALAHRLMHPSAEVEREYICRVHGEVSDEALERLKSGVELEDGPARFEELAVISRGDSHSWFRVVIKEGRNREVRRMWESQGLMVSRLKRIRYGNVELPRGLLKGHNQALEPDQIKALREMVGADDAAPSLTLQAVIGQRRAPKNANEFRPAPRTQQAWTGASDEGRELRAFDRIREDKPFSRPGERRGPKKKPGRRGPPGAGNPQNRDQRGPRTGNRPDSRGPGRGRGQNQNRNPNAPRGAGFARNQGQTTGYQPRPYQPKPSWAGNEGGDNTGRRPPPKRRGPNQNPNSGWRPPVTGGYQPRGPAGQGQQQRRRPDEQFPSDDIGNRAQPPQDGRPPPRGRGRSRRPPGR